MSTVLQVKIHITTAKVQTVDKVAENTHKKMYGMDLTIPKKIKQED